MTIYEKIGESMETKPMKDFEFNSPPTNKRVVIIDVGPAYETFAMFLAREASQEAARRSLGIASEL